MEPTGAAENLQVIRTLMERSALYRRAMAPVMLAAGLFGVAGCGLGIALHINTLLAFVGFWFVTAALTIAVALLIIRQQALRSDEPFWTPPTKRIVRAMTPALGVGLLFTLFPLSQVFFSTKIHPSEGLLTFLTSLSPSSVEASAIHVPSWALLYGLALHSAGLFISRGVRLLGWLFILSCWIIEAAALFNPGGIGRGGSNLGWLDSNAQMGLTFGLLHLIAAAYLFLTERRGQTTQSSAV